MAEEVSPQGIIKLASLSLSPPFSFSATIDFSPLSHFSYDISPRVLPLPATLHPTAPSEVHSLHMLQRTFSRALPRLAHHILYLPRPATHPYRPTADCIFHFAPGS